jgi:hypothetical protein
MPGATRETRYHTYSDEQRERLFAAGISPDGRSNGPAVCAYLLAGGERPLRSNGRRGWSVHHVYDGQHPTPSRTESVRAVVRGDLFTHTGGLVAVHPVADALADEFRAFAWLLRLEAFKRCGFDPDGVFGEERLRHAG